MSVPVMWLGEHVLNVSVLHSVQLSNPVIKLSYRSEGSMMSCRKLLSLKQAPYNHNTERGKDNLFFTKYHDCLEQKRFPSGIEITRN
jgi:hypothetical protein